MRKTRYEVNKLLPETSSIETEVLDNKGWTPFLYAVKNGYLDKLRLFKVSEVEVGLLVFRAWATYLALSECPNVLRLRPNDIVILPL